MEDDGARRDEVKADFKMVSIKTAKFARTFGGHVVEIQAVIEKVVVGA